MFLLFFNNSVNIRAIEGFFLQASPPALPHREGALQAERKRQSRAENGSFSMQNGVVEDNRDKGRQLFVFQCITAPRISKITSMF